MELRNLPALESTVPGVLVVLAAHQLTKPSFTPLAFYGLAGDSPDEIREYLHGFPQESQDFQVSLGSDA